MICGKIIYHTRTEAAGAVVGTHRDSRRRRGHHSINKVKETYYCRDCNGWHTSSGGKKSKRKRMRTAPLNIEVNYNARITRANRMKKATVRIRHLK